jgi:transcriptional regulator with XRE-family HTH domain
MTDLSLSVMEFDFKKVRINIRRLRYNKGFSQEYVAEKLGVAGPSYSRFESGSVDIKLDHIDKLAEIFGVTNAEILDPNVNERHDPFVESELKNISEELRARIAEMKQQLADKDEIIELLKEREKLKDQQKRYKDKKE